MNPTIENPIHATDETGLDWSVHWQLRPDTVYLNHGSFGPPPNEVRFERQDWIARLDQQPMDFYVRLLEPAIISARDKTAEFFGTTADCLVFVENATYGMNVVANSFPLTAGDQVLLNNHEYGAVHRIWDRVCRRSDALKVSVNLPARIESVTQLIDSIMAGVTDRTKLVVLSHITSPTALIMPVREICRELRNRGIAICIDGPHAPAQIDLKLDEIGCDFYTASCHKWLCAPFGSGFLYVHPRWQDRVQPPIKSWGRLLPAVPSRWDEEFTWSGTRDPSPYLTIPKAIEFMERVGLEEFRQQTRWLATEAETRLCRLFGTEPMADRSQGWYGSMAHVPLPPGDWSELQARLWASHSIEVPVINFDERWFIRVSCHLYNNTSQLETLKFALGEHLGIKVT